MFGDFFKNFLEREREEIEKHKVRIGLIIFLAVAAIIFSFSDFGDNEENISVDTSQVEENNSAEKISNTEKATDKKISTVQKVTDENIISVVGANAETLFVKDPFQVAEVEEIEKVEKAVEVEEEKNIPATEKFYPQVTVNQPSQQKNSAVEEKFVLSGTAIGDTQRTALVQHYKGNKIEGTLFLQVGDRLKGKKVVEITEDAVILEGGEKISVY